ncbi:MAG: twin-arginine translocase TatA/TatE family subunit [Solirubrobacterales bacterium]|jgi:TatA/E family protein of Tat protein translocase
MFGGWEILILAVIVLLFIGYKKLPEIGRSAGEGARQLKEGAQKQVSSARTYAEERGPEAKAYVDERKETAKAYIDEKTPDAGNVGRTAGKHVREYRELKEEIMGTPSKPKPKSDDPA